ncbi:MAG: helix-turn-helix domain-containing protein [Paracoccaceae bacterium]|nr:helix-turn-helix domain-containing protein [Paracoccaceae bacterium]
MSKSLPLVRLQLLAPLLTGLRECGVDPEPVLESVGLTMSAVRQEGTSVHVMVMHHFLENCAKAVDDPTFCAKIGSRLDPTGWPMVRQAFEQANTLGDFLNIYVSNASKYASSATAFIEVRGDMAVFGEARTFEPLITPAQNDGYMIGLQMAVLIRGLGALREPERLILVLSDPSVLPASFDACQALRGNNLGSRVQFPSEWLLHSVANDGSPAVPMPSNEYKRPDKFLNGFRELLSQNICAADLNAEKVAALVHLAPRTLARRLSACDTSISAEVTRAKIEYAKEALTSSHQSISEIASLLGYTNPSNFARAFAREENMSPTDFRSQVAR